MRCLKVFAILLCFVLGFGCSSVKKTFFSKEKLNELGLGFQLVQKDLSNGLHIIMVEDHTVPLVEYQTWVNVGSVDERFGMTGLAHLFEHLMFKGSQNYGPRAFFNTLESKGANVNAYTTRDYTVFHETVVPTLLDDVIQLEADRLRGLKLSHEVLHTEREVVYEERRLRTDSSPDGRLQEEVWALSYQAHPYRWPVIGYPEDLARLTVKDLEAFFKTYYQPSNVTLVIVGAIDSTTLFEKIKKAYGDIPQGEKIKRHVVAEPEQKQERRKTIYDRVASEKIVMTYPITSATETDTHALDVLSTILFSGSSSLAHRRLFEEKRLVFGVSGVSFTPKHPGLFFVQGTLQKGRTAEEFEKEIEALFREVAQKGVTEEEMRIAVRKLTVETMDMVRTAHGLAGLMGTVHLLLGDAEKYKDDLMKYSKVTRDQVNAALIKYLRPERKNVLVMKTGDRREGAL